MSGSTFFVQSCPVCGRHLEVRVRHLGKQVCCVHCRGDFVARDPHNSGNDARGTGSDLMWRADELLDRARNWIR
jgi:hypothetical protein